MVSFVYLTLAFLSGGGSLYRKELAIIAFNSKKRPPPPGVRGAEICLLPRAQASFGENEQGHGGSKAPPVSYVSTFRKIRECGKQNAMHRSKMVILHEKTSRYHLIRSTIINMMKLLPIIDMIPCHLVWLISKVEPALLQ